jgi:GxxExxY protein
VVISLSEQDLRHADVTRVILGAAFEVHQVLGAGFLESVYEEALTHELTLRGMKVQRQLEVPVHYKGMLVGTHVLDLVVEDKVVVEMKAVKELAEIHSAMVLSYLSATRLPVALLLNFGKQSLQHRRLVG